MGWDKRGRDLWGLLEFAALPRKDRRVERGGGGGLRLCGDRLFAFWRVEFAEQGVESLDKPGAGFVVDLDVVEAGEASFGVIEFVAFEHVGEVGAL